MWQAIGVAAVVLGVASTAWAGGKPAGSKVARPRVQAPRVAPFRPAGRPPKMPAPKVVRPKPAPKVAAPRPPKVAAPKAPKVVEPRVVRPHGRSARGRAVVPYRRGHAGRYRGRSYRSPYRNPNRYRAMTRAPRVTAEIKRWQSLAADLMAIGPNSLPGGPESKALARDLKAGAEAPLRLDATRANALADHLVDALAARRAPLLDAGDLARDLLLAVNAPKLPAVEGPMLRDDARMALRASGVAGAKADAIAADLRDLYHGPAAGARR